MEERELEEDDKDVKEDEDTEDKEVKVEKGSCLVVVRPDGSSLLLRAEVNFLLLFKTCSNFFTFKLLRAEVNFHLLFKTCSIIFIFKLLRAEAKIFSLFLSPVLFKSTSFF